MAHNDHLQEPIIERKRGAAKGSYYAGIAATASDFIVIAPDIETLRGRWATYTDVPLNEAKCVAVGLFSLRDIKELSPETASAASVG